MMKSPVPAFNKAGYTGYKEKNGEVIMKIICIGAKLCGACP